MGLAYRVFQTKDFKEDYFGLDKQNRKRVQAFQQQLKGNPYVGKPLGYTFFREKKFGGKRLLYLISENIRAVLLIEISNKKTQQKLINITRLNLEYYRNKLRQMIHKG